MKYPCLHFYVGDWKKDPAVELLSLAARGFWFELLCSMHERQNGGKVTANLDQLARIGRCSIIEAEQSVTEIRNSWVADVSEQNGSFTIINRRMQREWEISQKRKQIGSKGGASTQAKRKQMPEYEDEEEGISLVREFARGEGISLKDAEWFFWKCVGNGWTNGGKPIKDWKATLRSWHKAAYLPSMRAPAPGGRKPDRGATIPRSERPTREPTPEEFQKSGEIAKKALEDFRQNMAL